MRLGRRRHADHRNAAEYQVDANQQAEQTRGEGDGERNRIFAEAYGKDPTFFSFYRSMNAYEAALKSNDTRFLLRPESEFFRFFRDPSGKSNASPDNAPAPAAPRP